MEELVDEIVVSIERKLNGHNIELDNSDMDEIRDLLDRILENYEG
jgi:hypothetical protein